jgi:signal transduction histidine kinase
LLSYAAFYLFFAAVAARAIVSLQKEADYWFMVGMLAFYLLLLMISPWLLFHRKAYLYVVTILQTGIGLVLLLTVGRFDSFSILFIPLCGQIIQISPLKTAFAWIGAIILLNLAALLIIFPFPESISYLFVYPAAMFAVTAFCLVAMRAEEAQSRSEALLVDLQEANRKLQAYAAQVQELAAAGERNRLARELHDSVTQIIFGLTLSAQAARILIDRNPARAAAELDHIQVLAQNALAEMRGLIQQLHPRSIAEEGLAAALRRLAAERQANDNLTVNLQVSGERRLPVNIEEELYRIAQEALNNIVKHARTDQAAITLSLEDGNLVCMGIEDAGVGFDPAKARSLPGHLGLTSMIERIQSLGGTLTIDSQPGKGTRLRVELALAQEVEHA